jgi:hypothetical protein
MKTFHDVQSWLSHEKAHQENVISSEKYSERIKLISVGCLDVIRRIEKEIQELSVTYTDTTNMFDVVKNNERIRWLGMGAFSGVGLTTLAWVIFLLFHRHH